MYNRKAHKGHRDGDFDTYWRFTEVYELVIDSLRMAYLQRFSDVQIGNLLGGKRSLNVGRIGGMSRIAKALDTVPAELLSRFGLDYIGMCMFGYTSKPYHIGCGLMTMPLDCLLTPEKYWLIFHEAGHEAHTMLLNSNHPILNKTKEERKKLIDIHRRKVESNSEDYEPSYIDEHMIEFNELVEYMETEIFSDFYEYNFAFSRNWEEYLDTVWKYISSNYNVDYKNITRLFMIYIFMDPNRSQINIKEDFNLLEMLTPCVQDLERISGKIPKHVKDEAAAFFHQLIDVGFILANFINNHIITPPDVSLLDKIRSELSQGKIIIGVDPVTIIRSLTKLPQSQIDLRCRLATIMSLYNHYTKSNNSFLTYSHHKK